MPGFPIRTSSDQRFIDNSPRLNAALHVLHRLSMPRHPPCALNNEHTTNTQQPPQKAATKACRRELHKTQKNRNHTNHTPTTNNQPKRPVDKMVITACGLMLASTIQFSHNTPHQQPPPNTKGFNSGLPAWVDIQGIMPQTPNNAPTYPNKRVSQSTIWSTIILVNHLVNNHSG